MRQRTDKIILEEHGIVREEALLAYLNKELSAEEMQQMDKLLEGDPFAQEALEGLKQTTRATATAAVVNINRRVRERTGTKEGAGAKMHWTAYAWAAAVLGLLVGIGFIMVTFMGNKTDGTIAMNEAPQQENVNLLPNQQPAATTQEFVPAAGSTDNTTTVTETPVMANGGALAPAGNQSTAPVINGSLAAAPAEQALKENTATGTANNTGAYKNINTTDDEGTAPAQKPVVQPGTTVDNLTLRRGVREDNNAGRTTDKSATPASAERKAPAPELKKDKQQTATYTTQPVVRGSIMEKEETDRVTVITMDDAMKSFNNQDYKTSSEQFGEILKQQPNNADALYFGGISDYLNGNTKKSEKNFDKLLKDGNRYSEGSKWYKANILLKKGKRDEAKKLLDELANSSGSYRERAIKKKAELEF
jgi:tetratricopeptide (TPR) repeat protein